MTTFHTSTAAYVLGEFDVDPEEGLDTETVRQRREEYGFNRLQDFQSTPWWRILLGQFRSIVIYLLCGAAVLAFATGRIPEGIAVVAVIAVNTAIGFVSEWKALRSMAALRELGEHRTHVVRGGETVEIDAPELVPGDIVVLGPGDLVPADARIVEAKHLRMKEAPLTGESVPVNKTSDPVDEDTDLAERSNMLFKGTSVADGEARAVVVAIGTDTELGRISELAETAESTIAPLQERLDDLGKRLGWLTVGIAIAVAAIGILLREQETTLIAETALALGIAAIPEGLPIVATIALARGMYLMSRDNALVNRLTAIEALGATRVIFTDKTGTLTENEMRLRSVATADDTFRFQLEEGDEAPSDDNLRRVIELAVLANEAELGTEGNDPTEVALLEAGRHFGMERSELLETKPQVRIRKFEPREKKMGTVHEVDGGFVVAVKGAPAEIFDICDEVLGGGTFDDEARQKWSDLADELAGDGLRVLAIAEKDADSEDVELYEHLRLAGLVGLMDPPRRGVKDAIDRCQAAGIRVEMVTGDQPETARAIAREVGIVGEAEDPEAVFMRGSELQDHEGFGEDHRKKIYDANIFARTSPEQKLNLVRVYQDHGEIVAMTGDGVNDAPALKKADIGIAMGERGEEAARQVADMVLEDDAFETIVAAVEQGRVIFANIRKSVMFMLTTNVAEVIAVTTATLVGWTLPLLPLQILYLNVLTDVFPALALGVGPSSGHEMDEPPRDSDESIITRRRWIEIGAMASLFAACVLTGLLVSQRVLGLSEAASVTVSFMTIAMGKLWYTFAQRDPESGVFVNEVTRNPWVWGAVLFCIGLLLAAVYAPFLNTLLGTEPLGMPGWGLALGLSVVPMLVAQVVRTIQSGD